MKRRAKILLIAGGILMALGFTVCVAGAVVSRVNGDQLFAAKTGDGKGYTYYFSGSDISKIDLNVSDAVINIRGGAEKSCIELINFNENLYSFSCSNRLITFKESPDVSSVLRFWESGFTFKGMRYLLRFGGASGEKEVNVYLTDEDYVKIFRITAKSGKFSVSNIKTSSDYEFSIDNGAVSMDNISTDSLIEINAPASSKCSIALSGVTVKNLTVNAAQADLQATALTADSGDIDIARGSASIEFVPAAQYYRLSVNTAGKLTVNDRMFIDSYAFDLLPESGTDTQGETVQIPQFTVDGRELSVFLSGECFNNPQGEEHSRPSSGVKPKN